MLVDRVRLDDEQKALIAKIDKQMNIAQGMLDVLDKEYQSAMRIVNDIKECIKPLKDELSPLAKMKASVASNRSRDRYFPSVTYDDFVRHVESKV